MNNMIPDNARRYRQVIIEAVIIVFLLVMSAFNIRLDLTEDKRYTLSDPTRKILKELDKDIFIEVYLDGEMPIGFKKLKRTTEQYLEEFRIISGRKVSYKFTNPSSGKDKSARDKIYSQLIDRGLQPVNVMAGDGEGGKTQKMIFPGMTINCNKTAVPVNFLKNDPSLSADMNLVHSAEGLEYEIIQAISTATSDSIRKVAFIEGHGELDEVQVADVTLELAKYFTVDRGALQGKPGIIDRYSAVIIAKPEKEFSENDKFVIDQYIMNGGRVLWLTEEVEVNNDSLAYGGTVGVYKPLNIEDQLFRYGVRINPVIVQDLECLLIPVKITSAGGQPQYVPAPWIYYPLLRPSASHPLTRNLVQVKTEFANTIDTVGRDPEVKKKILLTTGDASRIVSPPLFITLNEATSIPSESQFSLKQIPVAVLLEGKFKSAFTNRMTEVYTGGGAKRPLTESSPTKMIVVADGDVIKNDIRYTNGEVLPLTLGLDRYSQQIFGNKEFIVNCINYLVDNNGLINLRGREIKPRQLNSQKIKSERILWQVINTILPLTLIILAGYIVMLVRRKKFTISK
jgi:ABC-2 type transport system permease protein